jgi:DNA-binding PadR family transcriptional regulator
LYGAIKRLLEQGWIRRIEEADSSVEGPGRPRKNYVLTRQGRRVLEAEMERLDTLAAIARLRTAGEQA